jgi:hypothetical protein
MALIPLIGIDEVQDIHAEVAQDLVGFLQRKEAFALQNVMDMGLGYSDHAGEAPLRDSAAPNAFPEVAEETILQMFESHQKLPRAIAGGNRVLGDSAQRVLR